MTRSDANQKPPHHGGAGPPGVLAAKLETLRADLKEDIVELISKLCASRTKRF